VFRSTVRDGTSSVLRSEGSGMERQRARAIPGVASDQRIGVETRSHFLSRSVDIIGVYRPPE